MTTAIQNDEPSTDLWTDLDRAFAQSRERFLGALGLSSIVAVGPNGAPLRAARLDVADTGKTFKITADVPGIPKDKLDIRVRGTSVEIRGEHAEEKEEKGTEYVHRERTYAGFYRSLDLPEPVVGDQAQAKVDNGVLELELPKVTPTPSADGVKVAVQ
jgi:HSP20 family protein